MLLTVMDLFLVAKILISLLSSPPDENLDNVSERIRSKSLNILHTNADQFLNKRDLLLVQIMTLGLRKKNPSLLVEK